LPPHAKCQRIENVPDDPWERTAPFPHLGIHALHAESVS
jgi:hypothetical protein